MSRQGWNSARAVEGATVKRRQRRAPKPTSWGCTDHEPRMVGCVSPLRAASALWNCGAHGVTRPTFSLVKSFRIEFWSAAVWCPRFSVFEREGHPEEWNRESLHKSGSADRRRGRRRSQSHGFVFITRFYSGTDSCLHLSLRFSRTKAANNFSGSIL